ncbi:MAG: class I SAM-dependent methyltransferase [Rhodospirillales bacterium]|nr:class I SAM-dependent methyltransferase [Rhodospirillales bacterium]
MDRAEFDKFADEYAALHAQNIKISGEGPDFFAAYKIDDVKHDVARSGTFPKSPTLVDVGSGVGNSVSHFRRNFPDASLICLDVSERSLKIAEERFPGQADYLHFDGTEFPLRDNSADLGFAACVLHHVDPAFHVPLLTEFRRILKPQGWLFIFEHNPLNPLTVQAVNTCPFDENAELIRGGKLRDLFVEAGFSDIKLRYRLFFPRFLSGLRGAEPFLTWLPLGAQYYVVARKNTVE